MATVHPLKKILQLIVLEKQEIKSVYFYAILSGLVQLSVPIGVQAIISFVLGASMVTSIYVLIVLVVLGVLLVGVFQMNQMKIIEKIQQRIFTMYAFEFAEKVPRFDLQQSDNYYLPEKVNRFFDTVNVQKSLSKLLLDIPVASIQIVFGLLLLAFYHPIFIAFGFLLVMVIWLTLKFTSKNGLITSLQESNYKYAVVAWLEEMARVIKSFKFSQGSHLNLQKIDKRVVGYLSARTAHFKVLLLQYRILVLFKVCITTAMLTVGTYLLIHQQLNIGEFIASEIVILTIISAVEKLISSLDSAYDVITGLEKLATITESPLEKDGTLPFSVKVSGIRVQMNDFNFKYPDGNKALKNVSFTIEPNSVVCISGKEGAGKTTLLKVLTGNYSDFTGSILLNNVPINNYKLEALRNKIGVYLNQQDIFIGTVIENISMGKSAITPEKVTAIAQQLGLQNFLHHLHYGFETEIDPAGKKLPSTIVKKILLLRAFANDPHLLLLEEPWQGLEKSVKIEMVYYLLHQLQHATVFVSSNDEDFAKECTYHIQLKNGHATVVKNK